MKQRLFSLPGRRAPNYIGRDTSPTRRSGYGPTHVLLAALLLGLLAACGPVADPTVAPVPATAILDSTQEAKDLEVIHAFYDTIEAGNYPKALAELTCQGQAAGAQIGPDELQYFQALFPWAGLNLVDVEPVGSSAAANGAHEAIYELTLENSAGGQMSVHLLVVSGGDAPCIDIQKLYF